MILDLRARADVINPAEVISLFRFTHLVTEWQFLDVWTNENLSMISICLFPHAIHFLRQEVI